MTMTTFSHTTSNRQPPAVFFATAAGPRKGFGHLIRCGTLADAIGCRRDLALRGPQAMTHLAVRLGWTVHSGPKQKLLSSLDPDLLVVDDPSPRHVRDWVQHARSCGVRVATIHDLGIAWHDSDLTIDGSIAPAAGADLAGPRFAVLNPALLSLRSDRGSAPSTVVIALGGGAAVRSIGRALAKRIAQRMPEVHVRIASGFTADDKPLPLLPARCEWLDPTKLAPALAAASAAVVGGGVTLYEACALGTPVVALSVVDAQRKTILGFGRAGAALDACAPTRQQTIQRAVAAIEWLLHHPAAAAALGRAARSLVDGRGAGRVVRELTRAAARAKEGSLVA
jgi:spore coat polysaccharide biosynthesis predicted glycosyltransferase SpsG